MPRKKKRGLYDNINAKRRRIKAGSGERMRGPQKKADQVQRTFEMLQRLQRNLKRRRVRSNAKRNGYLRK